MHLASHLAQARIVDRYRQALRDAAMYPAIHYGLARARIADVHLQAHRGTLARRSRNPPRRRGGHDDRRRNPRREHAVTGTAAAPPATASAMAEAACRFLDLLDDGQRDRAVFGFPGEPERSRWFYTPTDHGGLTLADCTTVQRQAALRLLATGLSPAGYHLAATIMSHEVILERLEDWPVVPGLGRVRDPLRYTVAIFGDPGTGEWGWRFAGHHLSLHYALTGGQLAAATPAFFGADPAEAPLPGGLLRPCAALEDLGRDLVRSFDEGQLAAALLAPHPPPDIVTGNRPVLEGRLWLASPREWFRDASQLPPPLLDGLSARLAAGEQALGPETIQALSWSATPAGVPWLQLRPDQQQILSALLDAYLGRLPDEAAEAERAKITGTALEHLHFAWAGGTEPHQPHYYRIQGPRLLAEYDNTARDANHVHTVWRDPAGDFGRDLLAHHYATSHH